MGEIRKRPILLSEFLRFGYRKRKIKKERKKEIGRKGRERKGREKKITPPHLPWFGGFWLSVTKKGKCGSWSPELKNPV